MTDRGFALGVALVLFGAGASLFVDGMAGRALALLPFAVLAVHIYWTAVPSGLKP